MICEPSAADPGNVAALAGSSGAEDSNLVNNPRANIYVYRVYAKTKSKYKGAIGLKTQGASSLLMTACQFSVVDPSVQSSRSVPRETMMTGMTPALTVIDDHCRKCTECKHFYECLFPRVSH
eukprot:448532-Amphidinium_carterae.1